jgi:hypothetical protein
MPPPPAPATPPPHACLSLASMSAWNSARPASSLARAASPAARLEGAKSATILSRPDDTALAAVRTERAMGPSDFDPGTRSSSVMASRALWGGAWGGVVGATRAQPGGGSGRWHRPTHARVSTAGGQCARIRTLTAAAPACPRPPPPPPHRRPPRSRLRRADGLVLHRQRVAQEGRRVLDAVARRQLGLRLGHLRAREGRGRGAARVPRSSRRRRRAALRARPRFCGWRRPRRRAAGRGDPAGSPRRPEAGARRRARRPAHVKGDHRHHRGGRRQQAERAPLDEVGSLRRAAAGRGGHRISFPTTRATLSATNGRSSPPTWPPSACCWALQATAREATPGLPHPSRNAARVRCPSRRSCMAPEYVISDHWAGSSERRIGGRGVFNDDRPHRACRRGTAA